MSAATEPVAVEVIYTAPTGKRTNGRIHRATCTRIAKSAEQLTPAQAGVDALLEASRATCCSVREFDRRNAVNAARSAEMNTSEPAPAPEPADVTAETTAAPQPAPEAEAEVSGPVTSPAADETAASDPKAKATAARAARIGTFETNGIDTHTCVGECGQTLPVRKFPTVTGTPGIRVAECRTCRDARTKAAKAAKSALAA